MTVMSSFTDGKANQTRCTNPLDRYLVSHSLLSTLSCSLLLSHALCSRTLSVVSEQRVILLCHPLWSGIAMGESTHVSHGINTLSCSVSLTLSHSLCLTRSVSPTVSGLSWSPFMYHCCLTPLLGVSVTLLRLRVD